MSQKLRCDKYWPPAFIFKSTRQYGLGRTTPVCRMIATMPDQVTGLPPLGNVAADIQGFSFKGAKR